MIDDDSFLNLIKEKIELISDKIRKEKIKTNPTAYMIKTIENLKKSNLTLPGKIRKDIQSKKEEEEFKNKKRIELLEKYDLKFESLKSDLKKEILENSKKIAEERDDMLKMQIDTFGIGNLPDNSEMMFKKIRNDVLRKMNLI